MILQILMYSLGQSANYSVSAPNPSWVCSVILGLEFCRPHLSLPEAVVLCRCGAPEGSWNTGGEKRPCSSLFCCCTCQLQPSNCSSPQLWKLVPASFFFFLLHFQNSLMGCSQRKLQQLGSVLRGLGPAQCLSLRSFQILFLLLFQSQESHTCFLQMLPLSCLRVPYIVFQLSITYIPNFLH